MANAPPLSPRQLEVLRLLGCGKSNKEIARDLGITAGTVRLHVTGILRVLGALNRWGAVVIAVQAGVIELGEVPRVTRQGAGCPWQRGGACPVPVG